MIYDALCTKLPLDFSPKSHFRAETTPALNSAKLLAHMSRATVDKYHSLAFIFSWGDFAKIFCRSSLNWALKKPRQIQNELAPALKATERSDHITAIPMVLHRLLSAT